VAWDEVVAAVMLIPMLGCPMSATAFTDETTVNPDVPMTVPAIIARSPNISGTRWRCFDDARWGRCYFDFDAGSECRRHRTHQHCRRQSGQHESAAKRAALLIPSVTISTGIHFETPPLNE
jgi:hypothetical protein